MAAWAVRTQDGFIKRIKVRTLREMATLRGHFTHIQGMAISPDGTLLIPTGSEGARLWSAIRGLAGQPVTLRGWLATEPPKATMTLTSRFGRICLSCRAAPEPATMPAGSAPPQASFTFRVAGKARIVCNYSA